MRLKGYTPSPVSLPARLDSGPSPHRRAPSWRVRPMPMCRRNAASHAIVAATLIDRPARSRKTNATQR
jgi:hypothetical protein